MKSERYKTLKIVDNNVRMNKKYLGRLIGETRQFYQERPST